MCRARRGCTARSTSSHCRVRMRDWRASLAHCRSSAHLLLPPPSPPPSPPVATEGRAAAVSDATRGRRPRRAGPQGGGGWRWPRRAAGAAHRPMRLLGARRGGGGAMCCGHRDAGEPCAERAERGRRWSMVVVERGRGSLRTRRAQRAPDGRGWSRRRSGAWPRPTRAPPAAATIAAAIASACRPAVSPPRGGAASAGPAHLWRPCCPSARDRLGTAEGGRRRRMERGAACLSWIACVALPPPMAR